MILSLLYIFCFHDSLSFLILVQQCAAIAASLLDENLVNDSEEKAKHSDHNGPRDDFKDFKDSKEESKDAENKSGTEHGFEESVHEYSFDCDEEEQKILVSFNFLFLANIYSVDGFLILNLLSFFFCFKWFSTG